MVEAESAFRFVRAMAFVAFRSEKGTHVGFEILYGFGVFAEGGGRAEGDEK
jgi:hypothetical protein